MDRSSLSFPIHERWKTLESNRSVDQLADKGVYNRDCTFGNIILHLSNILRNSFHPAVIGQTVQTEESRRKAKSYLRTRRPTSCLLIDFGLYRPYHLVNAPAAIT